MRIGLIIAMEEEIKSFLSNGSKIEIIKDRNKVCYKTVISGHDIYAIKSGYGIVDAAASTEYLITKYDVSLIINFGVVGALDRSLKVKDLFLVTGARNYTFDVSQIENVKKNQYLEFEDEFVLLSKKYVDLIKSIMPEIVEAKVASGDRFIEDKKDKEYLNSLGCSICDMEIVSIARVCYLNEVDIISIKCISDTFDGDGSEFQKNVEHGAALAFNLILKILAKV